MKRLVIRHGLSEANNRENYGTPAFGNSEAPLMPKGRDQATLLGANLETTYGVDLFYEPVAVSMMRRSQETAIVAGFRKLSLYPALNEEKSGMSDDETRVALETKNPPDATRIAARLLIEHPPEEMVWVTHALLIATLCQELDVYVGDRYTPKFCEIRELDI